MYYRENGSQISPCIITKARYALGVTNRIPTNQKKCSLNYWEEVVEIIGTSYNIKLLTITRAKGQYFRIIR